MIPHHTNIYTQNTMLFSALLWSILSTTSIHLQTNFPFHSIKYLLSNFSSKKLCKFSVFLWVKYVFGLLTFSKF